MAPRTLADFPDLMRHHHVHGDEHFDPALPTTEVYAPCCGRRTPADTVSDVRGIPGTVVRGGGHLPARDHDWLCDACRTLLVWGPGSRWTHSRFLSAQGAPPNDIRLEYAREVAALVQSLDHAHKGIHEPDGVMDLVLAQLPVGQDPHSPA
jgi:hypothetical protein